MARRSNFERRSSPSFAFCSRTPARVLTREVLIDRVWGSDYVGDTKTLDVHIKRLRTLIEKEPKNPTHISTVRGVGYRYEVAKA